MRQYSKDIHISLGMTTVDDRVQLRRWLEPYKDRFVFYHCTSAYPCPFENLHLLEIKKMKDEGWGRIGFSNHGAGIASDIAAMALGATYFERHFIDDRTFNHTDSAASLEPGGLSKLARDLKHVYAAMTYKPDKLWEEEKKQKDKLRPS